MLKSNYNNKHCINCGKNGHNYHNCNKPIISIGIIAVKKMENKINSFKYLLICRKHSLGYVDFLRGKYPLYNAKYILNLINEMTIMEKNELLTNSFDTLWRNLWGGFPGSPQYKNEERNSRDKFSQIIEGIYINSKFVNLEKLIEKSTTNWLCPEWGFPKGRRNINEKDMHCAVREFIEETGYNRHQIDIVKNISPLEEIFFGSNYKSYKHKYYLAVFNDDINDNTNKIQESEVSQLKWLDLDECLENIRHYNLEKKTIITKIDKILHKYRLIS